MKYCDLVGQLQVVINYLYLKLSYNTSFEFQLLAITIK